MPEYYSSLSDFERDLLTKLDQILGIVQDLQARQREMEARQKEIKAMEQKQEQGSFGSSE